MEETINNDKRNPHEERNDSPNTKEENYDTQWEVHRDTAQEESYVKYWTPPPPTPPPPPPPPPEIIKIITER